MTNLYRGACPACGWHGRTLTDQAIALAKSARHMLAHKHDGLALVETATGPTPAPWAWTR